MDCATARARCFTRSAVWRLVVLRPLASVAGCRGNSCSYWRLAQFAMKVPHHAYSMANHVKCTSRLQPRRCFAVLHSPTRSAYVLILYWTLGTPNSQPQVSKGLCWFCGGASPCGCWVSFRSKQRGVWGLALGYGRWEMLSTLCECNPVSSKVEWVQGSYWQPLCELQVALVSCCKSHTVALAPAAHGCTLGCFFLQSCWE